MDQAVDNEQILPVGIAPVEDFTKDMKELDKNNNITNEPDLQNSDGDSDKTVDYGAQHRTEQTKNVNENTTSPKGVVQYKHYGIKCQSPTVTQQIRRMHCMVCDKICNSKKHLNNHHRARHSDVTCPDCDRSFPTPDALQRHRYSHKPDHQLKCEICGKECAFQSDLQRHMEKHRDEKVWKCNEPSCNREFKNVRQNSLLTRLCMLVRNSCANIPTANTLTEICGMSKDIIESTLKKKPSNVKNANTYSRSTNK